MALNFSWFRGGRGKEGGGGSVGVGHRLAELTKPTAPKSQDEPKEPVKTEKINQIMERKLGSATFVDVGEKQQAAQIKQNEEVRQRSIQKADELLLMVTDQGVPLESVVSSVKVYLQNLAKFTTSESDLVPADQLFTHKEGAELMNQVIESLIAKYAASTEINNQELRSIMSCIEAVQEAGGSVLGVASQLLEALDQDHHDEMRAEILAVVQSEKSKQVLNHLLENTPDASSDLKTSLKFFDDLAKTATIVFGSYTEDAAAMLARINLQKGFLTGPEQFRPREKAKLVTKTENRALVLRVMAYQVLIDQLAKPDFAIAAQTAQTREVIVDTLIRNLGNGAQIGSDVVWSTMQLWLRDIATEYQQKLTTQNRWRRVRQS